MKTFYFVKNYMISTGADYIYDFDVVDETEKADAVFLAYPEAMDAVEVDDTTFSVTMEDGYEKEVKIFASYEEAEKYVIEVKSRSYSENYEYQWMMGVDGDLI